MNGCFDRLDRAITFGSINRLRRKLVAWPNDH
jgi:hypothetical protein